MGSGRIKGLGVVKSVLLLLYECLLTGRVCGGK